MNHASSSDSTHEKTLRILGTRGIPARYGGFETFAQHLALYLRERGWRVIVYCQGAPDSRRARDGWHGIERVHIPVPNSASGTVWFDWCATRDAARHRDLCLTLGYNTAAFCALLRAYRIRNVINMDGIEWRRAKWNRVVKTWFWFNERLGCLLGDCLVADHPEIARHLATRVSREKIVMIPYGGTVVTEAPSEELNRLHLVPGSYLTLVARPEPENNTLQIVRAFSRKVHSYTLVVLGQYSTRHSYHSSVLQAASEQVRFVGAVYDDALLRTLRFHSLAYVHGHSVGGTNPSLVEAMAAGNAVIAHDNSYNRWVAGERAMYFKNELELAAIFDRLDRRCDELDEMRTASRERVAQDFDWLKILKAYERLLESYSK